VQSLVANLVRTGTVPRDDLERWYREDAPAKAVPQEGYCNHGFCQVSYQTPVDYQQGQNQPD